MNPLTLEFDVAAPPINRMRHALRACLQPLRHARAYWFLMLPAFAIWGLAFVRVFVDPTPLVPVLFNFTPSLPYRIAVIDHDTAKPLARGDFVVFHFNGEAQALYPGLHAQPFFKRIGGVPGDRVTVSERQVFVNGVSTGYAKPYTFDRRALDPIVETVIPPGYYYVQGTHPDSFDSRYRASGLVRADRMIGRVRPIL